MKAAAVILIIHHNTTSLLFSVKACREASSSQKSPTTFKMKKVPTCPDDTPAVPKRMDLSTGMSYLLNEIQLKKLEKHSEK